MSAKKPYTQVSLETAEALTELGCADLAVYLPRPGNSQAVLYSDKNAGMVGQDYERLRDHGVSTVLLKADALQKHEAHIEDNLADILQRDGLAPIAKAELVQHVGRSIAQELTCWAGPVPDLERASRLVDGIVACALADHSVAPYLAHMACHHRSTADHMVIVSNLAVMLGVAVYGENPKALRDLGMAGLLHDLGKLAVDPVLLSMPGKLTPEEMTLVQQHPIESVRLLGDQRQATPSVRRMIIQHHERVDGRGYPLGLTGQELDLGSKILTLVDSFHAMAGPRPYRAPLTPLETNRVLNSLASRQFDPNVLAWWNALLDRPGTRTPTEWAVCGSERSEDELTTRHEHTTSDARKKETRFRRPRSPCHGKIQAVCVYAGRLEGVSSAPDRFDCPVQDLSRFGIGLRSEYPLYRGEVVHVLLRGRDRTGWMAGTVAWCRRQSDRKAFRCGIRFTGLLAENRVGAKTEVEGMSVSVARST